MKVTKDIVDKLNGEGGVRCMMVVKRKPVISKPIALKVIGKRKFIPIRVTHLIAPF